MFILNNMNYEKNYYDYISYVKSLNRVKRRKSDPNYVYYEEHHILPKSIFPEKKDDADNKVLLTAREHYLAHYLLCKIYNSGDAHYKMLFAFHRMQYQRDDLENYVNSRLYEKLKKELSDVKSKLSKELSQKRSKDYYLKGVQTRKVNGSYNQKEYADKISQSLKETYKKHPEIIQHLSDINKGKKHSEETKKKMSLMRKGHKVSDETKQKLRMQHSTGKVIINVTKNIKYPSLLNAEKLTGITRQRIKSCIENNKCDLNGDFWKYE